ncbi:Ig-like domain-containing protein [Bacillus sp. CGMCC 1.16607]|uniref:Ig-like domain-containing protein n=1 Tax=Bacillus sp. CGMCC 1.16607 TaxID=3351842 RepID=UPI00363FFEE6
MLQVIRHELKQEGNQTTIYLYLDPSLTEFARELGEKGSDEDLNRSIASYVKKKFPNLKDATVKVMVGSMLVTTFAMTPALGLFKGDKAEAAELTAQTTAATGDFTDLTGVTDQETLAAIKDLKERGMIQGFEDGTYKPGEKINRGTSALMFYRALGLKPTDTVKFPEINKDSTFYEAAQALGQKGVFEGYKDGKYHGEQALSLEQAAKALVSAYGLKAVPGAATPDTSKVSTSLKEAVTVAFQNGVLTQADIDRAKDQVDRADFAKYVKRGLDVYEQANPAVVDVASATVTSPTTTVVTLDKAKTGLTAKNFAVKVDGKTITPTNVAASADGKTYTLTHEDLSGKAGKININGKDFEFDFGAPSVKEVAAINANEIRISFNKELDKASAETIANYSINNIDLKGGDTATLQDDKKTVIIKLAATGAIGSELLTNNTHYQITAKKDILLATGDKLGADQANILAFNDTGKPIVTSVKPSENKSITLSFNERLDPATKPTVVINERNLTAANVTVNADGTVTLAANDPVIAGLENNKSYTIVVSGAKDLVGNTMDLYSTNFNYSIVNVAPAVSSIKVDGENVFEITFDENLSADLANGSTLKVYKGTTPLTPDAVTDVNNDNKTFRITLPYGSVYAAGEDSSDIRVVLEGYKDAQNNVGVNKEQTVSFVKDTIKPTVQKAEYKNGDVTLTFSEALGAKAAASYSANMFVTDLNGVRYDVRTTLSASGAKELLAPNAITAGAKTLVLDASNLPDGAYTLNVQAGAFSDQANTPNDNATQNISFTKGAAATTDTTAPAVVNVAEKSGTKGVFTVEFDEPVKGGAVVGSATNPANYLINGSAIPSDSTIYLSTDKKTATVTLPAGSITSSGTKLITVKDVHDLAGNMMNQVTVTASLTDNLKPELKSASINAANSLVLTFSEAFGTAAGQPVDAGDLLIKVNGATVPDAQVTKDTADPTKYVITSPTMSFATGTVEVEVKADADAVDISGNTIKTGTKLTATR